MKKYKKNYILIFILSLILLYYLFSQSIKRDTLDKENLENSSPCNESESSSKFRLGPKASNKSLNSFISNIEELIEIISANKGVSYIPNSRMDPGKEICKNNNAKACKKKVTKVTKLNDIKICLKLIENKLMKFKGSEEAGPDPQEDKKDNETVDNPNGSSHKLAIMRFGGDEREKTRNEFWNFVTDPWSKSSDKISKSIRNIVNRDDKKTISSDDAKERIQATLIVKEIEAIRKKIIPQWVKLSKKLNRTTDEN